MVELTGMVILIVGLAIGAILIGSVLVTSVGTLANQTKGTACFNCQATTKTLFQNTEIFIVIAILLAIIGGGIAAFKGVGGKR